MKMMIERLLIDEEQIEAIDEQIGEHLEELEEVDRESDREYLQDQID